MTDTFRRTQRNAKRWRDGEIGLRWTAAGMLEAEMQFRNVIGYTQLSQLAIAIERHFAVPQPDAVQTEEAATIIAA
jgi:putative transposase